MNYRFLCLFFCFCLTFTSVGSAQDEIDTELIQHLRTNGVENWQAEESKFDKFQVAFDVTYSDGPPTNPKHEFKQKWMLAYDQKRELVLARVQNTALPDGISHEASNSRYRFAVSCPDAHEQGKLRLIQMKTEESTGIGLGEEPEKWNMNWKVLRARSYLLHIPLREIVSSSSFEPVRVRLSEQSPGRIEFSARYVGAKGRFRLPGGIYQLVINPAHDDRLEHWEVVFPGASDKSQSFEISYYEPDDVPVPREVVYRTRSGTFESRQKWTIDRPEPFTIPKEEFYLPHYGFSEQVIETLSPNPWPRWLLVIAGIISIFVGIWLIRRRERA